MTFVRIVVAKSISFLSIHILFPWLKLACYKTNQALNGLYNKNTYTILLTDKLTAFFGALVESQKFKCLFGAS